MRKWFIKIVQFCVSRPGKRKEAKQQKGNEIREAYEIMLRETGATDFKSVDTADEIEIEKVVMDYNSKHIFYINRGKIVIKLNEEDTRVMPATITQIEKGKLMELVRDDDRTGVVTEVTLGSSKLKVTCAHVIAGMSLAQASEFINMNPMVYATVSKTVAISVRPVNKHEKCHLLVPSTNENHHFWIQTKPLVIMNHPLMHNSKFKNTTLGIILQFVCSVDAIFSGTVIKTDQMCFIVSSIYRKPNSEVITVIGWATIHHNMVSEVLV